MTCRKIQRNLSAYITGELSDREYSAVTKHLASCPRCRDAVRKLTLITENLSESSFFDPPAYYFDHFPKKIISRIQEHPRERTTGKKWLFYAVGASSTVTLFLVIALFSLFPQNFEQPQTITDLSAESIFEPIPESIEATEEDLIRAAVEISSDEVTDLEDIIITYLPWEEYNDLTQEEWEEVLEMLKEKYPNNNV
jgi:anti-sigma factor RsiW